MKFLRDLVKHAAQFGLDPETDLQWLITMPHSKLVTLAVEVQQVLTLC
jgi:hypothetical protein